MCGNKRLYDKYRFGERGTPVPSFHYGDIYEEGLAERIEAAHDAEMDRIEEMLNGKENENS